MGNILNPRQHTSLILIICELLHNDLLIYVDSKHEMAIVSHL